MERSYRILGNEADFGRVFRRLEREGLFWALDCEWEEPDWPRWLRSCRREDVLMLEGLVDGEPAGLLKLSPFMARTRCGEVGVAAYRDFFGHAAWLARGACLWCFERLDCAALAGRVAAPNRHALRMAPRVGFRELGRVPGMCWYGKKQEFVDGVILLATPESVREAESPPPGRRGTRGASGNEPSASAGGASVGEHGARSEGAVGLCPPRMDTSDERSKEARASARRKAPRQDGGGRAAQAGTSIPQPPEARASASMERGARARSGFARRAWTRATSDQRR